MVTGGTGFLGGHLAAALARSGADVAALGRADYDLVGAEAARRLFEDHRPQVVFHLAARVGGIGANAARPATFMHDNLLMGAHVIDAARRAAVSRLVLVGTVCSYPAAAPLPLREERLFDGLPEPTNAPYGIAKRALVAMCAAYRREHGLRASVVLPTNLYGPGDCYEPSRSHVVPAMIRRLCDAVDAGLDAVTMWGDGTATRELLYVEDAVKGLMLCAQDEGDAAPTNLGSGEEISMRDLAKRLAELCGYRGRIRWDASRPGGASRRLVDSSRAARLGFRAAVSLDEGLRLTVDDYRRQREAA